MWELLQLMLKLFFHALTRYCIVPKYYNITSWTHLNKIPVLLHKSLWHLGCRLLRWPEHCHPTIEMHTGVPTRTGLGRAASHLTNALNCTLLHSRSGAHPRLRLSKSHGHHRWGRKKKYIKKKKKTAHVAKLSSPDQTLSGPGLFLDAHEPWMLHAGITDDRGWVESDAQMNVLDSLPSTQYPVRIPTDCSGDKGCCVLQLGPVSQLEELVHMSMWK